MKTNLTKVVKLQIPGRWKERLHVKSFIDLESACAFQNNQSNNDWQIASTEHADKKAGIYAYAGGKWHNVKNLDASVLAHI
jgi:hypothetical protein